jgi:O-antigen ligase
VSTAAATATPTIHPADRVIVLISAFGAAAAVGVALAVDLPLGLALLAGVAYIPIVLLDLPLALALWIPLPFLEGFAIFNAAGKAMGLVLAVGWLAAIAAGRVRTPGLARHRRLVEALAVLNVWLTLSLIWAPNLQRGLDVWQWWAVAILFMVVATVVHGKRALRLVLWAVVAGAMSAVVASFLSGNLSSEAVTAVNERLGQASGDPNLLAGGLLPALVIAGALFATTRSALARGGLVIAASVMVAGLVATQSRGAFVTGIATLLLALVVFRRRRIGVLVGAAVATCLIAVFAVLFPGALERMTNLDESGSGRAELWEVGFRVYDERPLTGVGVNNFGIVAGRHVREAGALDRVDLIENDRRLLHNVYLQVLVENGAIGLGLLVIVLGGCMLAAGAAARRFDAAGDRTLGVLARAVLVSQASLAVVSMFVSNGVDRRLWVLLALGPAVLTIARATAPAAARSQMAPRRPSGPGALALATGFSQGRSQAQPPPAAMGQNHGDDG